MNGVAEYLGLVGPSVRFLVAVPATEDPSWLGQDEAQFGVASAVCFQVPFVYY